MEVALYPVGHCASVACWRGESVACPWAGAVWRACGVICGCGGYEGSILELFNDQERTIVFVLEYCKVPVEAVGRPVVSTSAGVGVIRGCVGSKVLC